MERPARITQSTRLAKEINSPIPKESAAKSGAYMANRVTNIKAASSRVKHEVDRALRPAALTKKEETSSDKKVVRKVMFKLEE